MTLVKVIWSRVKGDKRQQRMVFYLPILEVMVFNLAILPLLEVMVLNLHSV